MNHQLDIQVTVSQKHTQADAEAAHALLEATTPKPSVLLASNSLWNLFYENGTEMIITKQGRCLFPLLEYDLMYLDPEQLYRVGVDFEMFEGKYKFFKSKQVWSRVSNEIGHISKKIYFNEVGWQSGSRWMERGCSFQDIKLTNRLGADSKRNIFHTSSFHKYRPRFHLFERTPEGDLHSIFVNEQTSFFAVTHYQNPSVNLLKKNFNPHAKGFKPGHFTMKHLKPIINAEAIAITRNQINT